MFTTITMDESLNQRVHLLDLPDEMLLAILSKLNPEDALYSLLGTNCRLDTLVCNSWYNTSLDLRSILSTQHGCSVPGPIFNRYIFEILPRIHHHVKRLSVEAACLKQILRVGNFPQLEGLTLVIVGLMTALQYLKEHSIVGSLVRKQIEHLDLTMVDDRTTAASADTMTEMVTLLLNSCERLTSLTIHTCQRYRHLRFSLRSLPSTSWFSSTLTYLDIAVRTFDDCLLLLDGRLERLKTLIISIDRISVIIEPRENTKELRALTYFSLTSKGRENAYKCKVVPLLHRMVNLEQLDLRLTLSHPQPGIDGACLENDILLHLSRLHTFNFSIYARAFKFQNGFGHVCSKDFENSFVGRRIRQVARCVDMFPCELIQYHLYSIPYNMPDLEHITTRFPGGQYHSVRNLTVTDARPFEHEFFDRIAQAFPLLSKLTVRNSMAQQQRRQRQIGENDTATSITIYPHLTCLSIVRSHEDYIDQLLNHSNTHLPRLTELDIEYSPLRATTKNFTCDAIRHNCSKITHLFLCRNQPVEQSPSCFSFFPLLKSINRE